MQLYTLTTNNYSDIIKARTTDCAMGNKVEMHWLIWLEISNYHSYLQGG